jgi:hypothetical protein
MFNYENIVLDRLAQKAAELREAACNLASGNAREALLRRAVTMEAASLVIERWISPQGLRTRPGNRIHQAD